MQILYKKIDSDICYITGMVIFFIFPVSDADDGREYFSPPYS